MIQCQSCSQALYKYKEGKLCNAVLQSNWFTCAIKGFVIYPTKHLIGQLQIHNQVIECKIRTLPWKHRGSALLNTKVKKDMGGSEFDYLTRKHR